MKLEDWPESIKIEIEPQCQFDSSIHLSKDGYSVKIRKGFWDGLDEKQRESLLDHLIAHVTRGDLLAVQAVNDSRRWHMATDAVINSYLPNLPPGSVELKDIAPELYSEGCPPPPAESVWKKLKVAEPGMGKSENENRGKSQDDATENGKDARSGDNNDSDGREGDNDGSESGKDAKDNDSKDGAEGKDGDKNSDSKDGAEGKNDTDEQSGEAGKAGGNSQGGEYNHEMAVSAGYCREDIELAHLRTIHDLLSKGYNIGRPKGIEIQFGAEYPKRSAVKNRLERLIVGRCKDCSGPIKKSVRSWARENRSSEYLPGRIRRRRAKIVVAMDVSGSMFNLVGRVTALAKSLKSEYDIIPVVWADSAEILSDQGKYCVGTGTQPERMLEFVEKLRADHIIVVTDGEFSKVTPGKGLPPITWVTTKWSNTVVTRKGDSVVAVKESQL
ncbi:MAG: hypothetical protein QXU44_04655 [Candidatus Caldarchaeum sp.]